MKVAVLIAASGRGQRLGGKIKKQFLLLDGVPILARTLEVFVKHEAVNQIAVIVPEGELEPARKMIESFWTSEKISFVEGGKRRQDSIEQGLRILSRKAEMVCIHDGVRPFVSVELFEAVLEAAARCGGAVPVIPVTDTLKELSADGMINRTIPRERVGRVQTPQIFHRDLIIEAYRKARLLGVEATDDSYLLELFGEAICTVPGDGANIKITDPLDLLFAEVILKRGR
ncbi:MAG: 2-C-methyl-D-erythritol 4-phosphate cytidylyltransferase [Firmicutes bacterium]|nr:2-C-methyl-D-erythritol 4-phosphate cytidylyltransferase [Bacillota bacterium]